MVLASCKTKIGRGLQLGIAALLIGGLVPMMAFAAKPAPVAPPVVAAEPVVEAPVEKGNANVGQDIFLGIRKLKNGGPACVSCHSASVGSLDGGALGPNLTKVYETKEPLLHIDADGNGWANDPGIPTMGPVFSAKKITEEEMDNLRAFFAKQATQPVQSGAGGTFTIIGIIGAVVLLVFFNIVWSNRYRTRCNGTAHDALWRNYGGKGGR